MMGEPRPPCSSAMQTQRSQISRTCFQPRLSRGERCVKEGGVPEASQEVGWEERHMLTAEPVLRARIPTTFLGLNWFVPLHIWIVVSPKHVSMIFQRMTL